MNTHRIGECNLCRQAVFGGDGTPDDPGRITRGGKRVPHHHKKPYRVVLDPPQQDNDRGWMDHARRMGAW